MLKHPVTLEYLDICRSCLNDIPIDPIEPDHIVDTTGYDDEEYKVDKDIESQWSYIYDGRE